MRLKNDTNNFAASFNITPPYQMLVLHSKMLIYPRELYQRGVQRKRVEMIAADFNEYVANEPKVSFRNGKYYVVDGQHTIEGRILRNGGKDLPILCKVYTGLTMEQEALFFAEQNGHSAPLTAGIKLRAKVVGGDAPSKAFLAATNRVGLAFNYDSLQLSDYRISCVGTALKLYNQMGEKIYCESLRLIVAAWEGKPDSFRASVLRGVMHFVELYHGEFSEERLIRALGNVHPMEIYRVGRDNPAKLPGWKKYVFPMCDMLSSRGLASADLLLGADTYNAVLDLEKVQRLLDKNSGIIVGQIEEQLSPYHGVVYGGTLNFKGHKLNLISVDETYVDDEGKVRPQFPKTDALVTAPGCGHLMYSAITQINYGDTKHTTIASRRVPKFSLNQENDLRKTILKARPLAAPHNYCPWIRVKNVVG